MASIGAYGYPYSGHDAVKIYLPGPTLTDHGRESPRAEAHSAEREIQVMNGHGVKRNALTVC